MHFSSCPRSLWEDHFLIKADKTEEKHLQLHFSPHFSSLEIILNKHFIFHLLSFISNFTVPDLSLLFQSQTVPKAQYFSGKGAPVFQLALLPEAVACPLCGCSCSVGGCSPWQSTAQSRARQDPCSPCMPGMGKVLTALL